MDTQILVAPRSDAEKIASEGSLGGYRPISISRFGIEKLQGITEVLIGARVEWVLTAGEEFDGPWVYEFPSELVATLAETTPDQIMDLVPRCGDQPDLAGLDSDVFEPLLTEFSKLARLAQGKAQTLFAKLSL